MSHITSTVTMPDEDGYQKCVTTDLAKRLREDAIDCGKNGLVTMHQADVLAAAAEIERYYGGMLAWKRVACSATQIAEDELGDGAAIILLGLIVAVVVIIYITFGIGKMLYTARGPSEQELCEQRGGVYIMQRYGPSRCFSKEAFK